MRQCIYTRLGHWTQTHLNCYRVWILITVANYRFKCKFRNKVKFRVVKNGLLRGLNEVRSFVRWINNKTIVAIYACLSG